MTRGSFPGHELRERREALGLRVSDVHMGTRIPSAYLEALEEGHFEKLPASCYVAGFLRTHCEFLQLDPERYLDAYIAHMPRAPRKSLRRELSDKETRPSWVTNAITWATVCAIIAVGWISYTMVVRPNTNREVEAGVPDVSDLNVPDAPIGGRLSP